MNSIINYLFESCVTISIATLFFLLVLNKEKSFLFNRFYLITSVCLSLIIPFLHFDLGNIPSSLAAGTIMLDTLELDSAMTNDLTIFTFEFWIGCYAIVALLFLTRIVYKVVVLMKLNSRLGNSTNSHPILLSNSNEAFTFLNTIYLGDQIASEEKSIILSHERVHANEKHSYDILFFEIVCALFWINPVYHILKNLARTNHEYLADAQAINQYGKDSYIHTLAVQTIKKHGFALAHQFYNSSTLKRIKMINQQNNKIMKIKQVIPFVLGLSLLIVFGCEDMAQQLSEQDDITAAKTIKEYASNAGVYDMVDEQPSPKGGMTEYYEWVAETLKYPTDARKAGAEGRVFVQFILDPEGNFTNVKAVKGFYESCDRAAVELVKTSKPWTPGKMDGKPVSVRMVMPISFKLTDS